MLPALPLRTGRRIGDLNFDKSEVIDGYRRRDAITDAILKTFREAYGPKVTKEDIFYYVYGVLHSPGVPHPLRGGPEEDAAAHPADEGGRRISRRSADAGPEAGRVALELRDG